jgi:hypothetical protein
MATRLELIYNVKELMKDHTDDSLMSDRHILFLHDLFRARLLRQLYSDRSKGLDDSAMQDICLEMQLVDKGLCGITTPCTVARSVKRLPELLSLKGRNALVKVAPAVVGAKPFEIIQEGEVNSTIEDKYSYTSAFISDGYVYMVEKTPAAKLIKCISITGIFDTPNELEEHYNCCGCSDKQTPCVTDETQYPAPGHMLSDISESVLQSFLRTIQVPRDEDNDSVEQSVERVQPRRRR